MLEMTEGINEVIPVSSVADTEVKEIWGADVSRLIKKELKALYPDIIFSVRYSAFSMGNSVDISYTDGVSSNEINKVVGKYQYGHFDGMTDSYEYNGGTFNVMGQAYKGGVKYVSVKRNVSDKWIKQAGDIITKLFDVAPQESIHTFFDLKGSLEDYCSLFYKYCSNIDLRNKQDLTEKEIHYEIFKQ